MILGKPSSVVSPALFIGFGEQNDIACERNLVLREHHDGLGEHSQTTFEVDGASAHDVSVFDDTGKGIDGPLFAFDAHDIGMAGKQDRLLASISFQARDEVGFLRIRCLDDIDLQAEWGELGLQKRRDLRLVAGRIAGIDADDLSQQLSGVIQLLGGLQYRHGSKKCDGYQGVSEHWLPSITFQENGDQQGREGLGSTGRDRSLVQFG